MCTHMCIHIYIYIYIHGTSRCRIVPAQRFWRMETMLAETVLADLCALVAPPEGTTKKDMCISVVAQPVHSRQHTRAARARKFANMVSANMVSILPNLCAATIRHLEVPDPNVHRPQKGNSKRGHPRKHITFKRRSSHFGVISRGG